MGDGIIKTVVGTPVGVQTDVLGKADADRDIDNDGFVEVHEVPTPEDWDRIVDQGHQAEWERIARTQVGRKIKRVVDAVGQKTMRASGATAAHALIDGPTTLRATTTVARNAARTVGPMAAGVSAASNVGFAYLRDERPDWGEVAATAAWEGVSWAAAGFAGTATATVLAPVITPVGSAVTGVAVTYTAKQGMDEMKDCFVRWAYSHWDNM